MLALDSNQTRLFSVKICTTCGANLADDTEVCPNDGTPLFATAAAVVRSIQPSQAAPPDDEATMAVNLDAVLAAYNSSQSAPAPAPDDEATMAVDVASALAGYRSTRGDLNIDPAALLRSSGQAGSSGDVDATMAADIAGGELMAQVSSPPPAARGESTVAVDFLPDSLMAQARPGAVRSKPDPKEDPMAALAAAGLLKASVPPGATPSVVGPIGAPPLDEPTLQMGRDDQQEFQDLARQLINQGSESSMVARTSTPQAASALEQAAPSSDIDFDDEDEGDDMFVGGDSEPQGLGAGAFETSDDDDDAFELAIDDDDDDESPEHPMPGNRETGNIALSSLIDETLAEEGADLHNLPRAAPLAFGDHGVMTSHEQDAPFDLDLPEPKKFRRVKKATSRVLIGLLVLVGLLGAAIGVYYYLLPELGLESPYIVPYLDEIFAP